jgi:hypothetical protein
MKIYKYPLTLADEQIVELPLASRILSVGMQDGGIFVWALVDEAARATVSVRFWIRGTGHPADSLSFATFLGTVFDRQFVWHVFHGAVAS